MLLFIADTSLNLNVYFCLVSKNQVPLLCGKGALTDASQKSSRNTHPVSLQAQLRSDTVSSCFQKSFCMNAPSLQLVGTLYQHIGSVWEKVLLALPDHRGEDEHGGSWALLLVGTQPPAEPLSQHWQASLPILHRRWLQWAWELQDPRQRVLHESSQVWPWALRDTRNQIRVWSKTRETQPVYVISSGEQNFSIGYGGHTAKRQKNHIWSLRSEYARAAAWPGHLNQASKVYIIDLK